MKTYKDFITEMNEMGSKSSFGAVTQGSIYKGGPSIGWLSTNKNPAAGFVIYELNANDLKWFKDEKVSTENILRVATDQVTTVLKFNFKKQRVTFFDQETYLNTDKISWEKRSYIWKTLIIVDNPAARKAFNV
jgi:hypothetical protein